MSNQGTKVVLQGAPASHMQDKPPDRQRILLSLSKLSDVKLQSLICLADQILAGR